MPQNLQDIAVITSVVVIDHVSEYLRRRPVLAMGTIASLSSGDIRRYDPYVIRYLARSSRTLKGSEWKGGIMN